MQRKYRLGDGLLTTTDLEAMNKDDFSTIGAFVHEFKRKARKVHGISEETQCAIFLGLLTGSEASELTGHGGGNEKLTWATIDKGVEEGSLDQLEQHQVRLQRRKKKERDATASKTPRVKRIVTDVLATLGYDNEAEVQKKGVTVAQGRASRAVEEEARREDYGGEETGSQILTKAQRKQQNLLVGGQGSGKGQAPQVVVAPPPAATTTSATAGPSCLGPPLACGHWMPHCQHAPWPSCNHCTSCGGSQTHPGQMVPYADPAASMGPPSYPATQGPSAPPTMFRMWQEGKGPARRVEEIVGDSEEVTQRLKAGTIREEPIVVESDDEGQEDEGEPAIVFLGRMENLLEKAARTRSQNKAGPSQEPNQAPPQKEPEPRRRKEVVEVPEEEDEDDDEEDERLRQEEDQRAELRAKKRGVREETEPSLPDSVPKRKKYAVRMEEGFDVERMVDKLLEGHNDLMNLKDILASAPRLRGELKGRLSRRTEGRHCNGPSSSDESAFFRRGLKQGSQRRYKTIDKKCRPVSVLVTEDEEAYYERERGLIRCMREHALAGPCRINDEHEGKLIIGELGFLSPQERALMVETMKNRHRAYAFNDDECGRMDVDKISMIRIHTVPHEPWNLRGARYPNPDEEKMVVDCLDGKMRTHVADYSSGPYASPWFCFSKPNGTLRSVVRDFAKKTKHLRKLVRQDEEWVWGEDQEEAVDRMKGEFKEGGLVLGAPNYEATEERPFVIETDAGPTALGGVLIQGDTEGKERPLRSDFSKTAMQRGRRGARPRQRPQGASGGDDSCRPFERESTPVFNDDNIELFLDSYQAHAAREGWSTLERILLLRGVGRFEEPIAHIREEALTWQDVERRMQRLRVSSLGRDGLPIRLEEGNAEEFIPAYKKYMRDQGTGQEEWMQTLPLWTRRAERPLARQIRDRARDVGASIGSYYATSDAGGASGEQRERTPTTVAPQLTEPTDERMDIEVLTSGEPPPEPPPAEEEMSEGDPLREAHEAWARRPSGETKEETTARVQVRLEELYKEKVRMEAAGEAPKPPTDPPTSEQRISEVWAGYEDRRIREVAVSSFQRYSMLSDELAASRLEVEQLSTQLAEERAENQAWRSRMEAKEAEWEKRLQDMAAMVERLSATKVVDWTEQNRNGIQGKEVQGLFGQEGTTDPPQQEGMGKVLLDPAEAAARREAEERRFSFRTPTELASHQATPMTIETPEDEPAQRPQPPVAEGGPTEESPTILLEVQEGTLTGAAVSAEPEAREGEASRLIWSWRCHQEGLRDRRPWSVCQR
ncbi:hypothetical protein CBR_g45332 [Chara braunii]|uniref:Reverse transcriptase/retrotransposon-derived protein RNase H-like domain-containing protein n=1 Tax=Chara braunii TaxID=69332 RepID=A0A388LYG3_CHABU|nr:hypothetical protein CBR_g45332 [Chara braunii]|eukprot:GBG87272.1 hypothetical protein CBR_g45332 [Chara braunii]